MTSPVAPTAAVGVDVGGTKILGVSVSAGGAVLAERRVATPGTGDAGDLGDPLGALGGAVASLVGTLVADTGSAAGPHARRSSFASVPVGLGLPGMVSEGVLRVAPHLPGAAGGAGTDVAARVAADLGGAPVAVHNDVNLAASAELALGAARGVHQGLVVTVGTGIGGALVLDGAVRTGAHGLAGEVGHMVVDPSGPPCPCGGRGCWERFASGEALGRRAREAALDGRIPAAVSLAGGEPRRVRGEHVTRAAEAGDAACGRVVAAHAWWLALGLANLAAVLDPERIVVGGGLATAGALFEPVREAFAALVPGRGARPEIPIVPAALGERAGAIGAALVAGALLGVRAPRS